MMPDIYHKETFEGLPRLTIDPLSVASTVLAEYRTTQEADAATQPKAINTLVHAGPIVEGRLFAGTLTQLHEYTGREEYSHFAHQKDAGTQFLSTDMVFVDQTRPYVLGRKRTAHIAQRIDHYLRAEGHSAGFDVAEVSAPTFQWNEDERWFLANSVITIKGRLDGADIITICDLGVPDSVTRTLRLQHYTQDISPEDFNSYVLNHKTLLSGQSLLRYGRNNAISVKTFTQDREQSLHSLPNLLAHNIAIAVRIAEFIESTHVLHWGLGLDFPTEFPRSIDQLHQLNRAFSLLENDVPDLLEWTQGLHRMKPLRKV